ncbi:sulfatase [Saccharobesus litoralis]|uniref:Sulfatase n=1 Tax=Saccharobesus litoralis TaxID=2172099 RepID=A0A2S0VXC7_9ALTE|nr:sulfatase-like hydrolase/transferase [Saccharobesus litoralis]AWB68879.1 sulfatase [Saccharobesus litoralis]
MKRIFISMLMFLGFQFCCLANERPNVIVILADDLGYADVGYTGAQDIFTPNIDQLAHNGVEITNGYVTHPFCGPSRAGLMTGRYQARFGMEINISNSYFDLYNGLPLTETTFATRLQRAGYQTGVIGKWHLGGSHIYHPNNRGFDYFYGFLAGGHTYFPDEINYTRPLLNKKGQPAYVANEGDYLPLMRNNRDAEFNEYLTTALSKDAASFIKRARQANSPFMLYLAYNAPHQPLQAPKATIDKYKHIENKERRIYAAMIDEMDQGIGRVIAALKETKQFNNTLIFFLSDNGGAASYPGHNKHAKSAFSNSGQFRDGKGSMREGGSHVPFIAHWPNKLKPQKYNGLVSALDIAATAVAVGNGDLSGKTMDGVNLIPYLTNQQSGSPHQALFWRTKENRWAVRTQNAKYLLEDKGQAELYNMIDDPYETHNIIDKDRKLRQALASLWNQWNKDNINNRYLSPTQYQKRRIAFFKQIYDESELKAQKSKPLIIN